MNCFTRCEDAGMNFGTYRRLMVLLLCLAFASAGFAQQPFLTGRSDNQRTSANNVETFLTPANVNKNSFGRLFNYPLDYQSLAQPLYVPNVAVPGKGTHNVVYVATHTLPCASTETSGTGFTQEGIVATPVIDPNTSTMYVVAKTLENGTVRH